MDSNINNANENSAGFRDNNDDDIVMNNDGINDLFVNSNNSNNGGNTRSTDNTNGINGFANSDEFNLNPLEDFELNGDDGGAGNPAAENNPSAQNANRTDNANNNANRANASPGNRGSNNAPKRNLFSVSGITGAAKDFWNNLSGRNKAVSIVSTAIGITLIVVAVAVLNTSPYVTTYTGLDDKEAGEIMNILGTYNVKYRWNNTLKTISLREKDHAAAVAALAMEGYPRIGRLAYEPSAGGGLFETNAEKQRRYNQDLENKLAAAVSTINGIDAAFVTLSLPDNSRVSLVKDQLPSKAGVLLHIKPGCSVSRETVRGIENLIEKSVENLSAENISISDSGGRILNNYSDDTSMLTVADIKKNYETERENDINKKVAELLTPVFGSGGFTVSSSVTADFDKLVREAKNYTGTNVDENNGEQSGLTVGRATDRTISSSSDPNVMGAAGTPLNIDAEGYYEAPADPEAGNFTDDYHFTEELVVNYVISQMERTAPEITDVSLTVFLDADVTENFDDYDEEVMVKALATATGINTVAKKNLPPETALDWEYYSDYISIIALPFPKDYESEERPPIESIFDLTPFQFLVAVGAGLIVLIIIVVILVIVANSRNRRKAEAEAEEELYERQAVLAGDGGGGDLSSLGLAAARHAVASERYERNDTDDDVMPIEAKEQMLKRQIKMFTTQNPEIAAQLIRTLMKGEAK